MDTKYTCGTCKHMTYDESYIFPYMCEYEKGNRLSGEEVNKRSELRVCCNKYENVFKRGEVGE